MAGSTLASPSAEPVAAVRPAALSPGRRDLRRRFRRHRLAMVSAVVLSLLILGVVVGPWLWAVPINEIDFSAQLQGPSWAHPFGTDDLGQDLLARMMYGGRISPRGRPRRHGGGNRGRGHRRCPGRHVAPRARPLPDVGDGSLPVAAAAAAAAAGDLSLPRAAQGGVRRRGRRLHPDRDRDRRPALDAGGAAGPGPVLLAAREGSSSRRRERRARRRRARCSSTSCPMRLALSSSPRPSRSPRRSSRNRRSPSSASASPDIPTWGRLLFDAKDHLDVAPHWAMFPGAAIFLTVLSINFIGDGLRDALDPRRVI